jgi:tetratricopeptide (TPR) repeat protein
MSKIISNLSALIITFLAILISYNSFAGDANLMYDKANKLYRSGNYKEAAATYETIVKQGNQSASLYYNLGNAYYKQADIPKSILYFEKSLKLIPDDEDVNYNLKLAYARTIDKIEPLPKLFYEKCIDSFLTFFSPNTWSIIVILFSWLTLGIGIIYLFATTPNMKRNSFMTGLLFICFTLILYFTAAASDKKINGVKSAIIMDDSVYIKSSPGERSTNLFVLHGGTKIEILNSVGEWKQIKIANGNSGWILSNQIEVI